jgi:antitoxin MazE
MQTKIQKWGNSQGLRLSKVLLKEIHAMIGDEVDVYTHEGKIIIEPIKQAHGKYNLKSLIKKIPENYKAEEIDWGNPVGKEAW